jgi:hypothetical protein
LGDDKHAYGYEAEFDPWLTGLLECLAGRSMTCSLDLSQFSILPAKYKIVKKQETRPLNQGACYIRNKKCMEGTLNCSIFQAQVVENKLMTHADHFQKVNYVCVRFFIL